MHPAATSFNASYSTAYIVIALVVSVIMCVASGKLMEMAGHPFWAGALLGFFCGIFGLIVAIALYMTSDRRRPAAPLYPPGMYGYGQQPPTYPPPPPGYGGQEYQQPPAPGPAYGAQAYPTPGPIPGTQPPVEMITCPQCSAQVPAGTEFCGYCGVYLQVPIEELKSSWKVCPLCHNRAPATQQFCPICGSSLSESNTW